MNNMKEEKNIRLTKPKRKIKRQKTVTFALLNKKKELQIKIPDLIEETPEEPTKCISSLSLKRIPNMNNNNQLNRTFKRTKTLRESSSSEERADLMMQGKVKIEIELATFVSKIEKIDSNSQRIAISRLPTRKLIEFLKHSMDKNRRGNNEIIFIRTFLLTLNSLTSLIVNIKKEEMNEIIQKLSLLIKPVVYKKNQIICVNGEIGLTFYTIFTGSVAVIVPKFYIDELSYEEYLKHLQNLESLKEYDLLSKTIKENNKVYYDNKIKEIEKNQHDRTNMGSKTIIPLQDYISRINPKKYKVEYIRTLNIKNIHNYIYRKKVGLWKYSHVCCLEKSKSFGDIALNSERDSYRTATIIAIEDSYLGYLNKTAYQLCIQKINEKNRNINITQLLEFPLFKSMAKDTFEKYYFNYFTEKSAYLGDELFQQGKKFNQSVFVLKGEVEINIHCNLSYLIKIISYLKQQFELEEEDKNLFNNFTKMYQKFIKENFNTKQYDKEIFLGQEKIYKIYIYNSNVVLGFENLCIDENVYFCSGKVTSDTCRYFTLFKDSFDLLLVKENFMKKNFKNYLNQGSKLVYRRICDIVQQSLILFQNKTNGNPLMRSTGELLPPPIHHKKNKNDVYLLTPDNNQGKTNTLTYGRLMQQKTPVQNIFIKQNLSTSHIKKSKAVIRNSKTNMFKHIVHSSCGINRCNTNITNSNILITKLDVKDNDRCKSPLILNTSRLNTARTIEPTATSYTFQNSKNRNQKKYIEFVELTNDICNKNILLTSTFNPKTFPKKAKKKLILQQNIIDFIINRKKNREENKKNNIGYDNGHIREEHQYLESTSIKTLDFLALDRFVEKREHSLNSHHTHIRKKYLLSL